MKPNSKKKDEIRFPVTKEADTLIKGVESAKGKRKMNVTQIVCLVCAFVFLINGILVAALDQDIGEAGAWFAATLGWAATFLAVSRRKP